MTYTSGSDRRNTLVEASVEAGPGAVPGRAPSERQGPRAVDLPTDPVLEALRRCQEGDREAFRVVVEAYTRMVSGLVSRMVPQREEAEDLVQEVFVQAYKSLRSYRGESTFSTWLYRVAVNMTLRRLSQLRRRSASSLEEIEEVSPLPAVEQATPLDQVCAAEDQDRVREAVLRLPDKHRLVVTLHYFEDYSCQEIAGILGCSVGTVWSRLHYGLRKLRDELKWMGAA